MDLELNGKSIVISGASKGIGYAIAETLAAEYANIVMVGRRKDALEAAAKVIGERNQGKVRYVCADATIPEDAERVISQTCDWFGGLDVLINNVGGAPQSGSITELTIQDWRDCFDLNVLSMVNFVTAAEEELLKAGKRGTGRVITISSISGVQPGKYNPHYSSTKAATINISKYLANIYADKGIRVMTICPGPVYSESWERNAEQNSLRSGISYDESLNQITESEVAKIPLGRIGEGSDIGPFVAFLASQHADWVTGSCFHINGGKLASI